MGESEFERRRSAVRRVSEGEPAVGVARDLGRSEWWIHKWLRRYGAEGEAGLGDRSRAPQRRPNATAETVVAKILEVRRVLEESEFLGVGAEAILYELELESFEPRPSKATVERVLARAGATSKTRKRQRGSERHRPRPVTASPGVWQQADWVGPRYLRRRMSFSSVHLVDVGGGGAAAAQYPNRRLANAAAFFTDKAWPTLGIPWSIQLDNAFCYTTHKLDPWNLFIRTCLFFGVEVVISPPNELGWAQHVESFNNLWQSRTIRRHQFENVDQVTASSERFCHYYNHHRPHPRLQVATHGTRFPAQLIEANRSRLRFPPAGFSLPDHLDRQGRLRIPLARGRLTYLRRVQPGGMIEAAGAHFPVPAAAEGLCVAATVIPPDGRSTYVSTARSSPNIHSPSPRKPAPLTTPSHPKASTTTSEAERCPEATNQYAKLSDVLRRVPYCLLPTG